MAIFALDFSLFSPKSPLLPLAGKNCPAGNFALISGEARMPRHSVLKKFLTNFTKIARAKFAKILRGGEAVYFSFFIVFLIFFYKKSPLQFLAPNRSKRFGFFVFSGTRRIVSKKLQSIARGGQKKNNKKRILNEALFYLVFVRCSRLHGAPTLSPT